MNVGDLLDRLKDEPRDLPVRLMIHFRGDAEREADLLEVATCVRYSGGSNVGARQYVVLIHESDLAVSPHDHIRSSANGKLPDSKSGNAGSTPAERANFASQETDRDL